jgi:hypothetical protein
MHAGIAGPPNPVCFQIVEGWDRGLLNLYASFDGLHLLNR